MKSRYGKTVFQVMVIFSLSIFFLGAKEMKMTGKQRILLDFEKAEDSNNWFVINDGVMGGVSASSFQVTKYRHGCFFGDCLTGEQRWFCLDKHETFTI